MKLNNVFDHITSTQGQKAVASSLVWAAAQRVIAAAAAVEGIQSSIATLSKKFPERAEKLRASQRFADALKALDDSAEYAASIHGVVDKVITTEVDFTARPRAVNADAAALDELASFSGISKEKLIEARQLAEDRAYARAKAGEDLAAASFWAAAGQISDPEVKASLVAGALERRRDNILATWSLSAPTIAVVKLMSEEFEYFSVLAEKEAAQYGMVPESEPEPEITAPRTNVQRGLVSKSKSAPGTKRKAKK